MADDEFFLGNDEEFGEMFNTPSGEATATATAAPMMMLSDNVPPPPPPPGTTTRRREFNEDSYGMDEDDDIFDELNGDAPNRLRGPGTSNGDGNRQGNQGSSSNSVVQQFVDTPTEELPLSVIPESVSTGLSLGQRLAGFQRKPWQNRTAGGGAKGRKPEAKATNGKKPRTVWTVEETVEFFDSLREFGPNFALMAMKFPNKNRDEIKHKFLTEKAKNPQAIVDALDPQKEKPIDVEDFKAKSHETARLALMKNSVELSEDQMQLLEGLPQEQGGGVVEEEQLKKEQQQQEKAGKLAGRKRDRNEDDDEFDLGLEDDHPAATVPSSRRPAATAGNSDDDRPLVQVYSNEFDMGSPQPSGGSGVGGGKKKQKLDAASSAKKQHQKQPTKKELKEAEKRRKEAERRALQGDFDLDMVPEDLPLSPSGARDPPTLDDFGDSDLMF